MAFYVYVERDKEFDKPVKPGLRVEVTHPRKIEVDGHGRQHAAVEAILATARRYSTLRCEDSPGPRITVYYQPGCSMTMDKAVSIIQAVINETNPSQDADKEACA